MQAVRIRTQMKENGRLVLENIPALQGESIEVILLLDEMKRELKENRADGIQTRKEHKKKLREAVGAPLDFSNYKPLSKDEIHEDE